MPEPTTNVPPRETEYSFLQRLKTATAPQHAALEAQPLLQSLMTETVTRKQYFDYLLRMKEIVQAYEQEVLPLLVTLATNRPASALIEEDLQKLSPFGSNPGSLPPFTLPQNLTQPFAWGFAYVAEGSKLGGRVILKQLQKTLGITEDNGGAYLANKGANTGAGWKEFLQNLSSFTATHHCEDEVLDGAIFGFTSIHQYFEANGQADDKRHCVS